MRKSAFGFAPAASHATSSSRVSIGVMSSWSRAMWASGKGRGPYTGRARKGNAQGGADRDGFGRDVDAMARPGCDRRLQQEQPQQGPAGARRQLLLVHGPVIVGIGGLEALLDDRQVFLLG